MIIYPRKRFGQHFLKDHTVISAIVNAIDPQDGDHIVEIGPGLGALTKAILSRLPKITAIELDYDLVAKLEACANSWGQLNLYHADVLQFDFSVLTATNKIRLVGNLPYHITTALLFYLLPQINNIIDMHFMVQREVANRLIANVGQKSYGRLSIMVQYYFKVKKLFAVKPSVFWPPPKVQSTVIRLLPRLTSCYRAHHMELFTKVVRMSFQQRRKTLYNNLKAIVSTDELMALAIDPTLRPQNITLAQYVKISNYVAENKR